MQLAYILPNAPLAAPENTISQARRLFAAFRDRSQQVLDCAHLADLVSHISPDNAELKYAEAHDALTPLISSFSEMARDLMRGTLTPSSFNIDAWAEVMPEQLSVFAEKRVTHLDTPLHALITRVINTSVMRAVRSAAIAAAYAPPDDPSTRTNGYMRVALAQWRTGGAAASMMTALSVSRVTAVRLRGESPRDFANAVRHRLDTVGAPPIPPEARAAIEDVVGPASNTGADLELRFMSEDGQRYWAAL